jgi:deoxyuridine 5'-triphosphate nucleotidohydrolase
MKQYMRHNESKELYAIEENCKIKNGAVWVNGVVYSKMIPNHPPEVINTFSRREVEVIEKFTGLQTIQCEHEGVTFDLVYDDDFPVERATSKSIGIDVRCTKAFRLEPGQRAKVPTGVSWVVHSVTDGYNAELQVRARSGLADKKGLAMVNGVGTVDEDYCGEIQALLINLGGETIEMKAGEKIAQLILSLSPACRGLEEITTQRKRGSCGFGSTDTTPSVAESIEPPPNEDEQIEKLMSGPDSPVWKRATGIPMNESYCRSCIAFLLENLVSAEGIRRYIARNTLMPTYEVDMIILSTCKALLGSDKDEDSK